MNSWRQQGRNERRSLLLVLSVALVFTLTIPSPPSEARNADDARPALRSLSKAFTQVAQDAMPAFPE